MAERLGKYIQKLSFTKFNLVWHKARTMVCSVKLTNDCLLTELDNFYIKGGIYQK